MPQWQTFNGNNWFYLEDGVRLFQETYLQDIEVYTGTHGVCELDDVNGDKVEIILNPETGQLPVPR